MEKDLRVTICSSHNNIFEQSLFNILPRKGKQVIRDSCRKTFQERSAWGSNLIALQLLSSRISGIIREDVCTTYYEAVS